MKFSFGRNELKTKQSGQAHCYLCVNGLGGYASANINQSCSRNDHALFMAALKAPTLRYHLISKVEEKVRIDGTLYDLSSQEYVDYTKNQTGEDYLLNFTYDGLPTWHYRVDGVEIIKTLVVAYGENTVGLHYEMINMNHKKVTLEVTPCVEFVEKGQFLEKTQEFIFTEQTIESNNICVHVETNGQSVCFDQEYIHDVYYATDAIDGRNAYGAYVKGVTYTFNEEASLIFSLHDQKHDVLNMIENEKQRQLQLIEKSGAKEDLTKCLVLASDAYLAKRDSIDSLTLMAGFPYFCDWGRDTMYAVEGCCISTKRFEEAKDILRTFVKYLHKGIMPNLFPEGDNAPMYNTVDASVLFLQAMKRYYDASHDLSFVEEMYDAMVSIVSWYQKGTDFDIKMDDDGLIMAGSGYNQLTWMDVRYQNILPTPRHGKPVEVNAYWYSGLCTIVEFGKYLGKDVSEFEALSQMVKKSFNEKFWNEERQCCKDVVSGQDYDTQVRCNQIWAVSVPYSPLDEDKAKKVVETVYDLLYTPYGLRTLEVHDSQFVREYSGCLKKRDLSYHQGTTWTFPLGSYFIAYLKVNHYSKEAVNIVKRQLSFFEDCLREGCVGQIAEIYDGLDPYASRGCFAQGWSVGEILKVCMLVENL